MIDGRDILDEDTFRNVIDQLKSKSDGDKDIDDILWDALNESIENGDTRFAGTLGNVIRFHHNEEIEELLSEDDDPDGGGETERIHMEWKFRGFGKELRVFVTPGAKSVPRDVNCRFTIGDIKDLMFLDDDQAFFIRPAFMTTDSRVIDLWAITPIGVTGLAISATDICDNPSFHGRMILMGRDMNSTEPRSLSDEEIDTIRSAIRITIQRDSVSGTYYNEYVVLGLNRHVLYFLDEGEDADEEDEKEGHQLKTVFPFNSAVELINDCLGQVEPKTVTELDLSFKIFDAMVIRHGSKAEIKEHVEDYEKVIGLYDPLTIEAFRLAMHNVEILSDEQIEEMRRILES